MNSSALHEDMPEKIKILKEAVDEAQRYQAALRESEEKFRVLAETMPAGILMYQDDRWIYANRAAEIISGYAACELLKMNFWDIAHPDDRSKVMERGVKRQLGEAVVGRYEFRIIAKDGRQKWVELAGASTLIGGRPAGVIAVSDITGRKEMEEQLRKSEEKYRQLTETLPDVIFTMDKDLRITYMSPAITRLRGLTVQEALDQTLKDILTPESLENALAVFAREMEIEAASPKDLHRTCTLELEEICKDGSTVWTETIFRAIRNERQELIGLMGITRDISERKKVLSQIKILSGMLPICAYCKKIRDDEGYWQQLENYISEHSAAEFTSGMCPDCAKKFLIKSVNGNYANGKT